MSGIHFSPSFLPVVFVCVLVIHFAVMLWLVLYPGPLFSNAFKLYRIPDINYKMLLVALAALNFLICFFVEVSDDKTLLVYFNTNH